MTRIKAGTKSSNKIGAEAPRAANIKPTRNPNRALGKGKGAKGVSRGKTDTAFTEFST
jgi:hypothetical protein